MSTESNMIKFRFSDKAYLLSILVFCSLFTLLLYKSAAAKTPESSSVSLNGQWDFRPVYLDDGAAREKAVSFLEKKYPRETIEAELPKIMTGQTSVEKLPREVQKDLNTSWTLYRTALADRLALLVHDLPTFFPEKIIVPSFWTFTRDFSYPEKWNNAHAAWYRKHFFVPIGSEQKIIKLRFDAVNFRATVFVNGQWAGSHTGGFTPFEIDISDRVVFGNENELLVFVQDLNAVLNNDGRYKAPVGESGHQRGIWQGVSLRFHPRVYIDDLVVVTSVRKRELKLGIDLRNSLPDEVNVKLDAHIEGTKISLTKTARIKAGGKTHVTLQRNWKTPIFWSPRNPHLYDLTVSVSVASSSYPSIKDEKRIKFGFREFWAEGKHFFLNGKRINLRGDSINRIPGAYILTPEYIEAFFQVAKRSNINIIRPHTLPFPEFVLDIADQMGMLILDESAIMGWTSYDFSVITHFETFFAEWVRRDRNHPSVVMWSVLNECLKCGNEIVLFNDMIKRWDRTRPTKYEGTGDAFGVADTFDVHYPMVENLSELFATMMQIRTKDFTMFPYANQFWSGDKPITAGEFSPMFCASPDRIAFLSGEEVYRDIFGGRKGYDNAIGEFTSAQIRVMRYLGFAHIAPWTSLNYGLRWLEFNLPFSRARNTEVPKTGMLPKRIVGHYCLTLNPGFDTKKPLMIETPIHKKIKKAFQPIALFMNEQNRHFYGGEVVERHYTLFNDTLDDIELGINWTVSRGSHQITEGSEKVRLKAGFPYHGKIRFITPPVNRRAKALIEMNVYKKNKKLLSHEVFDFNIFPKRILSAPLPELAGLRVTLYDKTGETARVLDFLQLPYVRMHRSKDLDGQTELLIIGKDSLDGEIVRQMLNYVKAGGTTLYLEQSLPKKPHPLFLPLALRDIRTTVVFKLSDGHPVFSGIRKNDLQFWGEDYLVSGKSFIKPTNGRFRSLVDVGGNDGLNYTNLLEGVYGDGRVLFSQMLLIDKFFEEPMAGVLLRNLLAYAATCHKIKISDKTHDSILLISKKNSHFASFLKHTGIEFERVSTADFEPASGKIVILDCRTLDWNELRARKETLHVFLANGGKLLAVELNPFVIRSFNKLFGTDLSLRKTRLLHPQVEKSVTDEVLLWGISNYDLVWSKTPIDYAVLSTKGELLIREPQKTAVLPDILWGDALRSARDRAITIQNPGGALVKIQRGRGEILVNQIIAFPSEAKARRYFSTLITNLILDK